MTTFSVDDLRAGLLEAQQLVASTGSSGEAEKVARAQRWLGLGGDAEAFAAIARELETYVDDESRPWQLARIGGLWHLAGDDERTRQWCERVVRERRQEVSPWVRAGALYLQGEFKKASRADEGRPAALLANIARRKRVDELAEVRAQLVQTALIGGGGPHDSESGDPLTEWDWVEESFLLESRLLGSPMPSHLEMLQQCGVLREGRAPDVPAPCSPEVGLHRGDLDGGWLRVTGEDQVVVRVAAESFVVLRRQSGLWGAWITDDPEEPGEWVTEPVYLDWRHAATATAQWVSANRRPESEAARQATTIAELVMAAGGDAGEPVPKPRERVGLPREIQYPTIEFNDGDVIDIELAEDLILQFRTPLEAPQWYGRVAFEPLALMDDVVPPPHPTWQDAARQMMLWLAEHQESRGVSELEQLIREHS